MVSVANIKQGLSQYITDEIVCKMEGWQKWVAGAFSAMIMAKADGIVDELKNNSVVSMLGIIDKDGMIDIDALYSAFREQARTEGPVQVNLPMMGTLKLSLEDVDMIYRYIIQGG